MRTIPNDFNQVEFSEDEFYSATIYTDLQIAHLKNEIAELLAKKLTLGVTPEMASRYFVEQEYLRGAIESLRALIATHEKSKSDLLNKRNEGN